MKPAKRAPPDTVGNVVGRIRAVELRARQAARVEARADGDYLRCLGRHMRACGPELDGLRRRLAKAREAEGRGQHGAVPKPREAEGRGRQEESPAEGSDLLETLGALNGRRSGS